MPKLADSPPWRSRIVGYGEVDPHDLTANPLNWRTHPDHQRAALSGVLDEIGWVGEILVNQRTGHVVDGHARRDIALARNEPTVPVRYVDLSEDEERLVLATLDPISALAGSSPDTLTALLEGLTPADEAVANLLRELAPPRQKTLNPDDADLTPPDEPITQPGDFFLLGEHRLLCGDSTNAEDVARLMDGEKPVALLADPPYGINLDTDYAAMPKTTRGFRKIHGDDAPFEAGSLRTMWADVAEQFWFGANYYAKSLGDTEHAGAWFVWDKRVEDQYDAGFGSGFELLWSAARRQQRVLRYQWFQNHAADAREAGARDHPTQKPTDLYAHLIELSTASGDVVLDPFAGSGAALVAAERLERRCYAMEIDPGYCDVIIRRWERVTGGTAHKANA